MSQANIPSPFAWPPSYIVLNIKLVMIPQRKIKEAFIIQQEAPWERVG